MLYNLGRSCWLPLALAVMSGIPDGACLGSDEWLTASERKFFLALGADATVDGKLIRRNVDFPHFPAIAREAEPLLRRSIETIVRSREKLRVTKDERQKLANIQRAASTELVRQFNVALVLMMLGEEPWDATVGIADGVMRHGRIVDAWQLQADWLERGLRAQAEADDALGDVIQAVEQRSGNRNPGLDLSFIVGFEKKQLKIQGKAGAAPLKEPLIQIVLHRSPTDGKWLGMHLASVVLLRAMGIESMNFEAAFESGRLARAQELVMNRPMISTQFLPTVEPGQPVALNLGLSVPEICALKRVELRVWTAEGWSSIESLPGLDKARQQAIESAERELRDRLADSRKRMRKLELEARNGRAAAIINDYINRGLQDLGRQEDLRRQMERDAAEKRVRGNR